MEVYIRIAQWVGWPAVVAGIIIFGSIAFWREGGQAKFFYPPESTAKMW